jgi:hypothetical protein
MQELAVSTPLVSYHTAQSVAGHAYLPNSLPGHPLVQAVQEVTLLVPAVEYGVVDGHGTQTVMEVPPVVVEYVPAGHCTGRYQRGGDSETGI